MMKKQMKRFAAGWIGFVISVLPLWGMAEGTEQQLTMNPLYQPAAVGQAFDIVFAMDNSLAMEAYDYTPDTGWQDAYVGILEQAPAGSSFALVTEKTGASLQAADGAAAAFAALPDYAGPQDTAVLLQNAEAALAESQRRNRLLVFTAAAAENAPAVAAALAAIQDTGTAVVWIDLSTASEAAPTPNRVVCRDVKEIAYQLGDIYANLADCKAAARAQLGTFSAANASNPAYTYTSAFRTGKHNLPDDPETDKEAGHYFTELLNMYYYLPAYTTNYDFFNTVLAGANGPTAVATGNSANLNIQSNTEGQNFWGFMQDKATAVLKNAAYISVSQSNGTFTEAMRSVIRSNIKRRLPVLIQIGDKADLILASNDTGELALSCQGAGNLTEDDLIFNGKSIRVLDTATYFHAINAQYYIVQNHGKESTSQKFVTLTLPSSETKVNITGSGIDLSYIDTAAGRTAKLVAGRDVEFTAGVQVDFSGDLPNCYNANHRFRIKIYNDVADGEWYENYIFDMSNRGILDGYDDGSFKPENTIVLSEFLAIVVRAIGQREKAEATAVDEEMLVLQPIDGIQIEDYEWAKPYLQYAVNNGWLSLEEATEEYAVYMRRDRASYLVWTAYQSGECNVVHQLTEYTEGSGSDQLRQRASRWEAGEFEDLNQCNKAYKDHMFQLYMNYVLEGSGDNKITPAGNITRAEACKVLSKCLYTISENDKILTPSVNQFTGGFPNLTGQQSGQLNAEGGAFYYYTPDTSGWYRAQLTGDSGAVYYRLFDADLHRLDGTTDGLYYLSAGQTYIVALSGAGNAAYTIQMTGVNPDQNRLDFVHQPGGKYIYSSNPEEVEEEHLGENGNMLDHYENLSPGKYTYMAWYHNGTASPIYTDVLFNAAGSGEIQINRLGVQVFPKDLSPHWTGIQAYSDFLQVEIDNSLEPEPDKNPSRFHPTSSALPKQYSLSNSSLWLSDINQAAYGKAYPSMENYSMPIYIIMEFEVLSGTPSLSTVAYKTTTDKTQLSLSHAPYVQEVEVSIQSSGSPTWKGIAQFLPRTEVGLFHTITGAESDGYAIPVVIENTFGSQTRSKWTTNLNPQNDAEAYQVIPESSMMGFEYHDGYQWQFNTQRTSLARPPTGYPEEGFIPNDVLPFLTLPPGEVISSGYYAGLKKQQISISQGNYGVEQVYNLTLTNITDADWTFNYRTDTKSGTVVGISVDGDQMQYSCSGSFDDTSAYARFVGRTVTIPGGATVNLTVSVVLTTGDAGWINNEFYIAKVYD